MLRLRRTYSNGSDPVVLSLLVQAEMETKTRLQSPFEVLVRHLLDRLLNSESLGSGDESATRVFQMAYAVALPGLLVALFLYPLYHSPLGPRTYWRQVEDHLFYVTYGLVVMGLGTVLQWDLLFPDLLDTLILTSLPVPGRRLLLARVVALTIFLGCILVGTNFLGIAFLPGVADLHGKGLRHVTAHAVAVMTSGICVSAALIALQGLFVCVLGQRTARKVSPFVQALCVLLLLTVLFLHPLVSHYAEAILRSGSAGVTWFPPFWFLGMYERLLWGNSAPDLFQRLANTGLWVTAISISLALVTYPLAFRRRTKQMIEGAGTQSRVLWGIPVQHLLHSILLREPRRRAIFHWISQTVWKTQRVRLLLAVFGGLGLAMCTASVVMIHTGPHSLSLGFSAYGLRLAIPVMAFWTVAGLRTALRTPVSSAGSWAFRVIHGRPKRDHLHTTELWVAASASLVTVMTAAVLYGFAAPELRGVKAGLVQVFVALALPVLLTDIFFLQERAIPFTEPRAYSVNDLSFVVVTYFVLFPALCLIVVDWESWIEGNAGHFLFAILSVFAAHQLLRTLRSWLLREDEEKLDMEDEVLVAGEMGLRE